MNQTIVEREVGPEALHYVREVLSDGNTLAHYVLTDVRIDGSRIITYLPSTIPSDEINQVRVGLKLQRDPTKVAFMSSDTHRFRMEPVPNTDNWLQAAIAEYLAKSPESICVFEESLALPSDPAFAASASRKFILGDEICHFLDTEDSTTPDFIGYTLKEAKGVHLLGFMTRATGNLPRPTTSEPITITNSILREFAANAETIIVDAYDWESYLLASLA